ncbi:MAG TPA: aminotransferase class I/II-fold pyridoxal phosphate-dependent enzyme [Candidatus Desulfovibrio gallistercoris]|uniref:aminotransferase class I/II-fold pyridoxal phosphate-dependent enzyme n=1 Tax=uncultured Desulfovibrio sp. TaxID=167968 RepID=UPI001F8FB7F3|nr:aminotransferase class I/II-fold pyridoxal phosphate-dependent enzyme [uncultured Desulfovibrio sp.]HJA76528.1 aminotransferase class I/II-fold pyridoxal phosphate-dependent enzyme [Candidatus Desulfovibrio gallistercoris]
MKDPQTSQAAASESAASGFNRMRSKLSFARLVEMGAKMGLDNPLFLCHDRAAKATAQIDGKEYLNFSTYDYLDLNTHPEITEAVTEAARLFGSSAGASRLVGGERPPHRQLEQAVARLYGVEDCIAYVSGHATNVSTLGFMFGPRDAIFYDGLAHNSLMQGARLSGAERYSYTHNDCDALESLLKAHREKHKRAVIVTEGLFSMDGNIPDLPRLIRLKKQYDCMLLVDEAHSFGVLGATGRGAHEYFGIDAHEVDMWMSTLSKSMCGCGGFIAGSSELVEFLRYGSPGFVFSVGMPPIVAAACNKALELMLREPERVHKLQRISQYFLEYAQSKGLDTGAAQGYAIVPVMVGDSMAAGFLANLLFKRGLYVMPITFPAVKEGEARLRFFLSAAHSEEQIRQALDAVAEELPRAREIVANYKREHIEDPADD